MTNWILDIATDEEFNNILSEYNGKLINAIPFSVTGLVTDNFYYCRVKKNDNSSSEYSYLPVILTELGVPVVNASTNLTYQSFDTSWSSITGATFYQVDVSIDNFATNITGYNSLVVTGTTLSVTGLVSETEHKVRVRAGSVNQISDNSTAVATTTLTSLTETLLINSDHTGLIQLYLVETDGTWLQNLSSNSYYEYAGDFNYEGDKVVFARIYSGTNEDVVIKNIDDFTGSTEVRLTNTAGSYRSYDPSFNHDDSKILYTSEVSGTRLRTMNLDGTSNSSVAISTGSSTFQGRYSPDGQYLLYSRGGSPSYIERRNVDLSNTISPMHTSLVANFVSRWSKDSTKISYAYLSTGTYGLYKMNADGTGHTQLTSSNLGYSSEWSVDGSKIYYQYNNGTQYSLRRINADGTGNTDLIPVSGTRYIQPASIKEVLRPNISTRVGKYLFSSNANSQNGLFNGALVGSATASGGSCTIPNDNTSYLRIPASLINIATELTITAKIKINTLHTSSGQWNTLLTASRYNQADNFVLFYDAFNNRWTYRHSGVTEVNFSNSTVEDGAYHFICFQVKLGVGAYSKVFIDDMSTPISTGGNTLTLLDCNMFLFGQDVDSWTGLTPSLPSGFDTNQSWAGLIEFLNIETRILDTSELNTLKTEAGF
jgi:Tol biopolymer transport system component